jgi:hypothetical protein
MPYGEGNGGGPEVNLGDPLTTVSDFLLFKSEDTPYEVRARFGDLSGEATLAAPEKPSLPVFRAGARAFPDQPGGEAYYGVDAGPFQYNRAFTKFPGGTGVRDTVSGQLGNVGLSYQEAQQRIEGAREELPGSRTLSAHLGLGSFGARVGRKWTEENLNPFGWSPPPITTVDARWNRGPLSLSGMFAKRRGEKGLADYGGRGEYTKESPFGLGGKLTVGAGIRPERWQPDGPPPGVAGDFWARYGLNF